MWGSPEELDGCGCRTVFVIPREGATAADWTSVFVGGIRTFPVGEGERPHPGRTVRVCSSQSCPARFQLRITSKLGTTQAESALLGGLQGCRTLCKQAEGALPYTNRPKGNWPRTGHELQVGSTA